MSEQQKNKEKTIDERYANYLLVEAWLEKEKAALVEAAGKVYDPNLKIQAFHGFSYIPAKIVTDVAAAEAVAELEKIKIPKTIITNTVEDFDEMVHYFHLHDMEIPKKTITSESTNILQLEKQLAAKKVPIPTKVAIVAFIKENKGGMKKELL